MKNYFLVEVTTYNDGTADASALYTYDTLDKATAAFHQKMAGAINNAKYQTEMCLIVSKEGATCRFERWERPVVDEEPEVEE